MIKLLQKKEISTEESPIMLQRRHTVMDVDKGCILVEPKSKSVTRSNSASNLDQTKGKHSKEKAGNETLSPEGSVSASNASTVVITDSELSSSWLYSSKKAQIKTSPRSSSSRIAEENDEMKSPMLPMSRMRSSSKVGERTKKSSCCCYSLIILIIGVATLGILTAIASILYMEFFASYNITDIQLTTTKPTSQTNVPLKKVGHSVGVESQKVLNPENQPGRTSESVLFPQSSTKDTEKEILSEKQIPDQDVLAVDEKQNRVSVKETVDSSSVIIDDLLNLTSQMINSVISDQKEVSNPINALFSRNQNLESHYSKLFELYQGLRPAGSSIKTSSDASEKFSPDAPEKISPDASDKTSAQLDQDSSIVDENIDKDSPIVDENIDKDSPIVDENIDKDSSVDSKDSENLFRTSDDVASDMSVIDDSSKDLFGVAEDSSHLGNLIEEDEMDSLNVPHENPSKEIEFNQELDQPETSSDKSDKLEFSLKPLHQTPEENLELSNSFRNLDIDFEEDKISDKQPIVSEADQPLANLPISGTTNTSNFIPKFLSQLDRTWGISTLFRNADEDLQNIVPKEHISDETDLEELNLPISETNIAVPRPVEMTRRSGQEDKENIDQSSDMTDHDRRFSLAKALDRLRLLDANNILPSSRQGKMESPKKKDEPKIQTDQEVATERSHYLENLRKKFFE